MEALAIIGGIVSIAQAGDQLTKLLTKVKPLFDAPLDVQNLINEVSDFTGVLSGLLNVLEKPDFPTPDSLPSERFCVLQRLVEEAITVLEDLRGLGESFLKTPPLETPGRALQNQKVRRVAWARKASQVDKSRSRLRDIRLTVLLQLASLQL
jgi:hypothetical protein